MSSYVLGFQDIDKTRIMVVGGKSANLGEISRLCCQRNFPRNWKREALPQLHRNCSGCPRVPEINPGEIF